MKWRFGMIVPLPVACGMLLIIVWICCTPKPTQAFPAYSDAFVTRYNPEPGFQRFTQVLNSQNDMRPCGVCHMNPQGGGLRTLYGGDFESVPGHAASPANAFQTLENRNNDADRDGLTDLTEIQQGFFQAMLPTQLG
jgi:hypothetical protein